MQLPHADRWDILARTWLWFTISGVTLVLGIFFWASEGLNYGIDFEGGALLQYEFERPAVANRAEAVQLTDRTRRLLVGLGLAQAKPQPAGERQLIVRIPLAQAESDAEARERQQQILQALNAEFGSRYGKVTAIGRAMVGGVISKELGQWAILALALGSALILLYIGVRYEFRFAVAAIIATLHDAFVLIGIMAILRVEIDSTFVAALLTILGYSVNDTVVIFDRIRENMRLFKREPFDVVCNASLWQTMARSINTGLGTMFSVMALFTLGGAAVHGFALAMMVGLVSGAYSSVFTASPIVALWKRLAEGQGLTVAPRPGVAETPREPMASPEPVTVPSEPEPAGAEAEEEEGEAEPEAAPVAAPGEGEPQLEKPEKRKRPRRGGERTRRRRF